MTFQSAFIQTYRRHAYCTSDIIHGNLCLALLIVTITKYKLVLNIHDHFLLIVYFIFISFPIQIDQHTPLAFFRVHA